VQTGGSEARGWSVCERSRFIENLREICRLRILDEKWLLAPSLRVGYQWVDQVARSGQPALNVRVKTTRQMALELAAAEMDRLGVSLIGRAEQEVLVGRLLLQVQAARGHEARGYLPRVEEAGLGLVRIVLASLMDLRLAGKAAEDLPPDAFEAGEKGVELRLLLKEYERHLERRGLFDFADVFRTAAYRLERDPASLPPEVLVLMPEERLKELRGLERRFWETIPAPRRTVLEGDTRFRAAPDCRRDIDLLSWISRPDEAPPPRGDGSIQIFRALGEGNELREVFRRIVAGRIPFDEVEILYTDGSTYLPLLYELSWQLVPDGSESVPVTLAEGVPPRYSRPARALAGWISWIRQDYAQTILVRMIQDGLLWIEEVPAKQPEEPAGLPEGPSATAAETSGPQGAMSFSRLGALLRSLPIGSGRNRYSEALAEAVSSVEGELDSNRAGLRVAGRARDEDDEAEEAGSPGAREHLRFRLLEKHRALTNLKNLIEDLLSSTEGAAEASIPGVDPARRQHRILEGARSFLSRRARVASRLDAYAHEKLIESIQEFSACLEAGDLPGLDPLQWLEELLSTSHVLGMGPRPGCLHAAPLWMGGHSGRPHVFIVGLDDARFPGAGLQDPVLLDAERERISEELPTAASRADRSVEIFAELLCRLRGTVTLSYCCRSLEDDREVFPSPVLLAVYRIASGEREGDQESFFRWLQPTVSFAPSGPEGCMHPSEWWLWRTCTHGQPKDPLQTLGPSFPHLARGLRARRARQSDVFTPYDGYAPSAGRDHDFSSPHGPVLSSSRLETLGLCPLEYFFRYVLGLEPMEEYVLDPMVWLSPVEKGTLLHGVFRKFMSLLQKQGRAPDAKRDGPLLEKVLEEAIRAWQRQRPPPNREILERESAELAWISKIFLEEEHEPRRGATPFCFEASVGLPAMEEGTPLDCPEPVWFTLVDGKRVRLRGRIDRIDELLTNPSRRTARRRFVAWDYKTGSAWRYMENGKRRREPFYGGRVVQHYVYVVLAESRLKERVSRDALVEAFGWFFPTVRDHGERVLWKVHELAEGQRVISDLCQLAASGVFSFTDDAGDVKWSDYWSAFGDVEEAVEALKRKLANPQNEMLEPFRRLRGLEKPNQDTGEDD